MIKEEAAATFKLDFLEGTKLIRFPSQASVSVRARSMLDHFRVELSALEGKNPDC